MDVFARRRAGVLLHPTSLPGSLGNGDLGPDAYRFVDLLVDCRITLWQTLPLGPTHEDLSPYQCLSVHAGDFRLISLQPDGPQTGLEGLKHMPSAIVPPDGDTSPDSSAANAPWPFPETPASPVI